VETVLLVSGQGLRLVGAEACSDDAVLLVDAPLRLGLLVAAGEEREGGCGKQWGGDFW